MPARAARRGEDAINRSLYRRMTLIAGNAERLAEIGGAEEENIDSWRGGERLDIVDHRAAFDMTANNDTGRVGEKVREDRKSVVMGKGVLERVDVGGRRIIYKKKNKKIKKK